MENMYCVCVFFFLIFNVNAIQAPKTLTENGFKDIARQLVENSPGNKLNVIFGGICD